jgi:hypothetical protein
LLLICPSVDFPVVDLLAVAFDAEPEDFPAAVFEPVDWLAEVFDDEPPEDLAAAPPVLDAELADDLPVALW